MLVTLITFWAVDNRVCIFCGRTGAEVKITREHTFPNWINGVLTAAVVGPDITYERRIEHGPNAGTVDTWPASAVADHVLRAVCTDCNSGWMEGWESAVRPLILPMIKGEPAKLTVDEQLTVATWAAMKTAVFQYIWSEDPILTAADRDVIMTQNRPPASVQVRLAAIESNGTPLRAHAVGYKRADTGDEIICMTLTIGCMVVQVFGGPGAGTQALRTTGRPGTNFIGIYPPAPKTVQWPPPTVLNDQTLPAFSHPLLGLADAG
jgi:hypothetical protein